MKITKDIMWGGAFRFLMEQAEPLIIGSILQLKQVIIYFSFAV
jgi:hypothetical protein